MIDGARPMGVACRLVAAIVTCAGPVLAQPAPGDASPPTARFPDERSEPEAVAPPQPVPAARKPEPTEAAAAPEPVPAPAPTVAPATPSHGAHENAAEDWSHAPSVYVGGAIGATWFRADSDASNGATRAFRGTGFSTELALGGRIGEHSSWAFVYASDRIPSPSATDGKGRERNMEGVSFEHVLIGVELLLRPLDDPRWRFRLGTGPADLNVTFDEPIGLNADDDPSGWGYLLGVGYDVRFAGPLRAGVELRTLYSSLSLVEQGNAGLVSTDVTVLQPSLMLTVSTR